MATAKEKVKAAEAVEKKATTFEKASVLAEKKSTKMETKLGETELKLVEAESLNLAQVDEIADFKVALEACENKWYNEGFTDAKKSTELVVHQARKLEFEEGWLAALQAIEVPEDSSLRNPN